MDKKRGSKYLIFSYGGYYSKEIKQNTITQNESDTTDTYKSQGKGGNTFLIFCGLIGSDEQQIVNFDLKEIFQTHDHNMELDYLISEQEIIHAINSWPSQKSPGSDDFTG
jgi:hypothetical protein